MNSSKMDIERIVNLLSSVIYNAAAATFGAAALYEIIDKKCQDASYIFLAPAALIAGYYGLKKAVEVWNNLFLFFSVFLDCRHSN